MRFSLMTEPQLGGTYDQLLGLARWAEESGFVSFARSDHYYSGRDPRPAATDAFVTLAGLARDTTSIRLCVLVSPITFRHPAVIAKSAATIDQMAGGRLDLGIGTGWMELEHQAFGLGFPEWGERFERLTESLQYVRAAFEPGAGAFTGEHYSLEAEALPKPADTRLVVGGSGPRRTPTLAGMHADEYNHFVATPETIGPKVAVMRDAAGRAGRDPDDVEVTMMGPIIAGRDRAEFDALLTAAAAERDTGTTELRNRWKDAGIPIGTPDEVRDTLSGLSTAGVDRYYLQWIDIDDRDRLEATYEVARG